MTHAEIETLIGVGSSSVSSDFSRPLQPAGILRSEILLQQPEAGQHTCAAGESQTSAGVSRPQHTDASVQTSPVGHGGASAPKHA
jgi:hypothetical protein